MFDVPSRQVVWNNKGRYLLCTPGSVAHSRLTAIESVAFEVIMVWSVSRGQRIVFHKELRRPNFKFYQTKINCVKYF